MRKLIPEEIMAQEAGNDQLNKDTDDYLNHLVQ